jgi:hypothetical protein
MASPATPARGVTTWQLDAPSSVEFSVKHMMLTTVSGRFKELSATRGIPRPPKRMSAGNSGPRYPVSFDL